MTRNSAKLLMLLFALVAPLAANAQGKADAGKEVFRKCQACHSVEVGQNKIGPSLAGVIGRKSGSIDKFNYSPNMRRADLTWTTANLDKYLTSPSSLVPGTRMYFTGLSAADDRANVIAYLASVQTAAVPPAAAPQAPAPPQVAQGAAPAAPQVAQSPANGGLTAGYTANVAYILRTGVAQGRMVYIGVGGEIDGIVNPPLAAAQGDVVQVTLINGEGAEHDIVFDGPGANVRSQHVLGVGAATVVAFRVERQGDVAYFCSLPGHRAAGMEGRLVVAPPRAAPPPLAQIVPDISLPPSELPPPLNRRTPANVQVNLETVELEGKLADGTTYTYWTFNRSVPGPFIRARVGDTIEVSIKNDADSSMTHSVDFHAATGPGGGATYLQVEPGAEKKLSFKALMPGIYVYHCATPMVAHHIASGMYGLILVEPEDSLPKVDHEFYVMQGEIYTTGKHGELGNQEFSIEKLLAEQAEYLVFNGTTTALTTDHPLRAKVGETVRIYFGVGGPNYTSSFHVIGEIFDRVYLLGDLINAPGKGIQSITVPPGGAAVVEFKLEVPGRYLLVDHALSRLERGLLGILVVEGEANPEIYKPFAAATAGGAH